MKNHENILGNSKNIDYNLDSDCSLFICKKLELYFVNSVPEGGWGRCVCVMGWSRWKMEEEEGRHAGHKGESLSLSLQVPRGGLGDCGG